MIAIIPLLLLHFFSAYHKKVCKTFSYFAVFTLKYRQFSHKFPLSNSSFYLPSIQFLYRKLHVGGVEKITTLGVRETWIPPTWLTGKIQIKFHVSEYDMKEGKFQQRKPTMRELGGMKEKGKHTKMSGCSWGKYYENLGISPKAPLGVDHLIDKRPLQIWG